MGYEAGGLLFATQMLPIAAFFGKELWYSYTGIDLQSNREISVALFFYLF